MFQPIRASAGKPQHPKLRGIHYVGDPSQDPDLDEDTMSHIAPPSSPRGSMTSSSAPSDGVRSSTDTSCMQPISERKRSDSNSFSDSDGSSACPVHIELFPAPRPTRRLTPRTCKAAFPPIDLESPYAPYAPTPPLSPPAATGLNNPSHKTNPFHLPKTLRKLPSTASIFRKASRPSAQQALRAPSHSSLALSLHDQSSDSVRTHSKGPSLETEHDSRPSGGSHEEFCPMSCRGTSRSSSGHSVNSSPSYKTFRSKFGLSSRGAGHPLQRSDTHNASSSVQPGLNTDLDRTINSKTKGLSSLFTLPVTRMRTYSSLSSIFKTSKPHSTAVPSRPFPCTSTSEVQANISALLSTDTGVEILAAHATE